MITEDYVSFETAKLLKKKGFDEYYPLWYNLDKPTEGPFFYKEIGWHGHNSYDYNGKRIVSAPTLQMAMKWLREVHNLCIEPYRTACGYLYTISTIPYGSCKCNPKVGGDDEDSGQWTTYEGACESAINYCLTNLI